MKITRLTRWSPKFGLHNETKVIRGHEVMSPKGKIPCEVQVDFFPEERRPPVWVRGEFSPYTGDSCRSLARIFVQEMDLPFGAGGAVSLKIGDECYPIKRD